MAVSNATNFSNAKEMFEGRAAYKEEYPKTDIQFDSGYTNRLFGKVDTLGNAIQINESFLSFFGTKDDKSNVSCINFMADAFADCRKQYNVQVSKGNVNTSSPYFNDKLSVYQGWKKQESLYYQSNDGVYKTLLDYIYNNSFKIADFDYYVEVLLKFLKEKDLPLTRIGFFESNLNPSYTSGLILDIYEGDAGDDSQREQFITDPNYSLEEAYDRAKEEGRLNAVGIDDFFNPNSLTAQQYYTLEPTLAPNYANGGRIGFQEGSLDPDTLALSERVKEIMDAGDVDFGIAFKQALRELIAESKD